MFCGLERNVLTCCVNRVTSVLFIPLREIGGLMHVLDDLSPTNTRVVSTEGNLAFLSAVRNHAHLCAAEVVIEKILKPHSFYAEHSPDIARIVGLFRLHTVIAIGT